jgi:hypothetical protein
MSAHINDPEQIADALIAAHPEWEPFEISDDQVLEWSRDEGVDLSDDQIFSAVVLAWELRRMI